MGFKQRFVALRPWIDHRLFILFTICFLWAIIYAKFLLSVMMFALSILVLIQLSFKDYPFNRKHGTFLIMLLPFLAVVFSGVNSSDLGSFLHHVKMKLPFLILPFVWSYKRQFFAKNYKAILCTFVGLGLASIVPVAYTYFADFDSINKLISKGQSMPTPLGHIMYSLCLLGALNASIYLLLYPSKTHTFPKWFLISVAIIIFVFQHILASRTGVVLSYFSLAIIVGHFLYKHKKYMILTGLLACLFISPILAIKIVPSFKNKIAYANWDLKSYFNNQGVGYSDSERILSYKAGWVLIKQNPLLGTGIGDLRQCMKDTYLEELNHKGDKYPHNEYLFHFTGMGVVGLLLLMITLLFPIWYYRKEMDIFFFTFQCVFMLAFLVENTIERQQMIAYYLFFSLCGLAYMEISKQASKLN